MLDHPQTVLSVSPQWLNPGDSVTLTCRVKESSTGWRFFWYRTVPYTAGLPSLSDRSYSVEPLSGSGTSEDSYTLIPAGSSHTGGYVCRAGRGDPVYDTLYSEPQFFWSRDLPRSSVRVNHPTNSHYSGDTVKLQCELSDDTDWICYWLINKEQLSSQTSKTTTTSLSDQAGQYQCEGTRTRPPHNSYLSLSFHISVTALPETALNVNPNPAYTGETGTLTCSVELDSGWSYTW
ncbi:uncharacterized protein LOC135572704 [Oncorhynchus nerka]|uniref:uncharacterized protein LOC135572704 n=1 Tax=Oncorhynchus nerka TaxID=8023 RepID=UPI0031B8B1BD